MTLDFWGDVALLCTEARFGHLAFSIVGLLLDIAGFILLSLDLIRLQQIAASQNQFSQIVSSHLTAAKERIRIASEADQMEFRRATAEFEARRLKAGSPKTTTMMLVEATDLIERGGRLNSKTIAILSGCIFHALLAAGEEHRKQQTVSLKATKVGVVLICIGFVLQIIGTWPCPS